MMFTQRLSGLLRRRHRRRSGDAGCHRAAIFGRPGSRRPTCRSRAHERERSNES
jgi:hypothetical protein